MCGGCIYEFSFGSDWISKLFYILVQTPIKQRSSVQPEHVYNLVKNIIRWYTIFSLLFCWKIASWESREALMQLTNFMCLFSALKMDLRQSRLRWRLTVIFAFRRPYSLRIMECPHLGKKMDNSTVQDILVPQHLKDFRRFPEVKPVKNLNIIFFVIIILF